MACDTRLKPRQTLSERKAEVKQAVAKLDALLARGAVKPKVGPQGAIAFLDWLDSDREGVTDGCAYRQVMTGGSALAKAAIARAEALAGRQVDKATVAQGAHSHDGGRTWRHGH
jgi:hypothetical protein